jgi:hypothetical protein
MTWKSRASIFILASSLACLALMSSGCGQGGSGGQQADGAQAPPPDTKPLPYQLDGGTAPITGQDASPQPPPAGQDSGASSPSDTGAPAPDQTAPTTGNSYGQKCGGAHGACKAGLVCVQFNESGNSEGLCTAYCSSTQPCPSSPAGGECVFKLSDGKTICGFLCTAAQPACPPGLACTKSAQGQYYYCSTDPPAQCGNNKMELAEECDGTDLNNMTCQALGFTGGQLVCTSGCKLDKGGCTGGSTACANLPPKDCTGGDAYCSKLVLFSPFQGTGYSVTHGQSYSHIRQDTMMLVKYAAASVACMMPGSFPVGLGDMSMSNGGTPATASGQLRHPQGTHDGGRDIDIAYFQTGQPDNSLRPVCPHTQNGVEQYHCVGQPTTLDASRSALFLAKLFESNRVRVIGVDGQIGPVVAAAAKTLHTQGKISTASLNAFSSKLAYETTNTGKGWFQFHHHHLHMSTWTTSYGTPSTTPPTPPLAPELTPGQVPPMVFPLPGQGTSLLPVPDPDTAMIWDRARAPRGTWRRARAVRE